MKRLLTILVFLLAVSAASAQEMSATRLERSELRFLEGMSDHHQMALDMANDCLANAESAGVRDICQAVIDAQSAEIDTMRAWLLDWYNVDYTVMSMMTGDPHAGMNHSGHGMPATDPAMMMGMFAGLNRLDGADYEIAWLESMIDHHDDALHMSERLLARGVVHEELGAFAQAVIDAQTAEIAAMEALLASYG